MSGQAGLVETDTETDCNQDGEANGFEAFHGLIGNELYNVGAVLELL
ncbi:MAG: hypothetical protein H0V18_00290 [Pyrinomonadaceae bacterium]|nr:hypothetical protein [Pyrinomonadaceae bacterium]